MKKLTVFILLAALMLTLAACSGGESGQPTNSGDNASQPNSTPDNSQPDSTPDSSQPESDPAFVPDYQTVREILDATSGRLEEYCVTADTFTALFSLGDVIYFVEAGSSDDVYEQVAALDYDDPDYDDKAYDIVKPLSVREIVNLTAGLPTDAELAAWAGKTGRDLDEAGFKLGFGDFDGDETVYFLYYKDYYQFRVTFNEKVAYVDDMDEYEAMLPLTVKSVEFNWYHC